LLNLLELNPNFIRAHEVLGRVYEQQGEHDRALREWQKAAGASSDNSAIQAGLAHALISAGNAAAARQILIELEQASSRKYISAYRIAEIYLALGHNELAFQWLERAYRARDVEFVFLKVNPTLDPLRNEPGFKELVARVSSALL
jgi:Tfp pilus assembly protein PilF